VLHEKGGVSWKEGRGLERSKYIKAQNAEGIRGEEKLKFEPSTPKMGNYR